MKVVIKIIGSIVLFLAALGFSGCVLSKRMVSDTIIETAISHVQNAYSLEALSYEIPITEETETVLLDAVKDILQEKEVQAQLNEYLEAVVSDVAGTTQGESTLQLDEILQEQIAAYADDVSDITQGALSSAEAAQLLHKMVELADVQELYDYAVRYVQDSLTMPQSSMLQLLAMLQQSTTRYLMLFAMVGCSALLVFCDKPWHKGFWLLGGLWTAAAITVFILPQALSILVSHLSVYTDVIQAVMQPLRQLYDIGGAYIGIAIVCFAVGTLLKFFPREQRV